LTSESNEARGELGENSINFHEVRNFGQQQEVMEQKSFLIDEA
jgi:hypothetical protein